MVGAIEMLNPLIVFFTEEAFDAIFIFEIYISQDMVSLHYFIKDVEIQRKFVHAFNLLDELSANWASNSEVMVQV